MRTPYVTQTPYNFVRELLKQDDLKNMLDALKAYRRGTVRSGSISGLPTPSCEQQTKHKYVIRDNQEYWRLYALTWRNLLIRCLNESVRRTKVSTRPYGIAFKPSVPIPARVDDYTFPVLSVFYEPAVYEYLKELFEQTGGEPFQTYIQFGKSYRLVNFKVTQEGLYISSAPSQWVHHSALKSIITAAHRMGYSIFWNEGSSITHVGNTGFRRIFPQRLYQQ